MHILQNADIASLINLVSPVSIMVSRKLFKSIGAQDKIILINSSDLEKRLFNSFKES
jgi:hypothetical protein